VVTSRILERPNADLVIGLISKDSLFASEIIFIIRISVRFLMFAANHAENRPLRTAQSPSVSRATQSPPAHPQSLLHALHGTRPADTRSTESPAHAHHADSPAASQQHPVPHHPPVVPYAIAVAIPPQQSLLFRIAVISALPVLRLTHHHLIHHLRQPRQLTSATISPSTADRANRASRIANVSAGPTSESRTHRAPVPRTDQDADSPSSAPQRPSRLCLQYRGQRTRLLRHIVHYAVMVELQELQN